MITVIVELQVIDRDRAYPSSVDRYFVRHYEDLPWPRLPNQGETLYLNAADIFSHTDVPIRAVTFHPSNSNVTLELEPEEITSDSLYYLVQLHDLGFTETEDPYRVFSANTPTATES
jgi:hypothetical protein